MLSNLGVIELLCDLIKASSHPGVLRQEEETVRVLAEYCARHGLEVNIEEVRPGRPNLLATLHGNAAGPRLMFCGHTDTVPPNAIATRNLFAAEIHEGRVFGRGAVDMKGALAAMAGALVALKNAGLPEAGEVVLAAVIDEEMESLGAEALIRAGFKAEAGVIGEPTGNRIAVGHKGLEWLEIEFEGKATHGGTAEKGVNAIAAAARFVHLVETALLPRFEQRRHTLIGAPTLNWGTIQGGDQPSTVAARCVVQLDRRWVPTETVESVFDEIEEILSVVRKSMAGLRTHIRRVPGGMATMIHGPLEIALDHPLVTAARRAYAEVIGREEEVTAFPAWTDAALFSREAGIPCIVCGPGDLSLAHSAEESIAIAEVEQAMHLYFALARSYCAGVSETVRRDCEDNAGESC